MVSQAIVPTLAAELGTPICRSVLAIAFHFGHAGRVERTIDGGVVLASTAVPGTDDLVVLLDPERRPDGVLPWHPFRNILRVTPADEIVWRAELVPSETTAKCWHGVEFDGTLRAWTYSYNCELDPANGQIIDTMFTK